MKYQKISGSDLNVSAITLGTWVLGGDSWGGASEADGCAAIHAALDAGITLIDTAPIYGFGKSEEIVGRALKHHRDQTAIATKCGLLWDGKKIKIDLSPDSIRREIEDSLRRLQTDWIDIYQCHWPDPQTPLPATLECLMKLKQEGKIRYIGVSNFDQDLLKKVQDITAVATLQNQYSMLERDIEQQVLPFCRQNGVGVISYGPLAGGILTGKYHQPQDFERDDARTFFYKYYSGLAFEKVRGLLKMLESIKRPLNQIAINWVRQQPGVTSVIVGSRNPQQVSQNTDAIGWDLTAQDLTRIQKELEALNI